MVQYKAGPLLSMHAACSCTLHVLLADCLHRSPPQTLIWQAAYFEQKFYATFFLTPDALPSDSAQRQRRSGRTQSADSHSPANSPRDLLAAQSSAAPPQHPPAQPPHPTRGRQRDGPHIHSHAPADAPAESIPLVQEGIGHSEGLSTPDLSPRGGMEAEDPPTPRMNKAIIPTAAPNQTQGSTRAPKSPRLRLETSQVVLHQGHYDQHHNSIARQHASPQRHFQHKGPEQAIEDLKRTVRHAPRYCMILHNNLQPWQRHLPCACNTSLAMRSDHCWFQSQAIVVRAGPAVHKGSERVSCSVSSCICGHYMFSVL